MPTSTKTTTPPAAPPKPETLAEALVAFQTRLPRVGKNKTATVATRTGGSYSYKYADLGDVVDVVLPLLNEIGISFTCQPRRCDDGSYALVGVLAFAPSNEAVEGWLPLKTNGTPQELGSAITYARRYLLTSMTGVVAEEDDDAQVAVYGEDERVQAQLEADRKQAERNVQEDRAGARFRAANPGATREAFRAAVEQTFAQPYDDVTAEQFKTFLLPPPNGGEKS